MGENVPRLEVGDRIFSRPRNGRMGAFAEFIAIDKREAALMASKLNYHEAGSLPLVALTSWQALVDVANLKPRQQLLIPAGSGGAGTFAIQLAKHLGAEVWTTTSGKNLELVKSLGADHIINYQNEKFEERVNNLDVVFDTWEETLSTDRWASPGLTDGSSRSPVHRITAMPKRWVWIC